MGLSGKATRKEYNNTKTIANQEFTINTSIEDASYVNRMGVVCAVPKGGEIPLGSYSSCSSQCV
jgi:hypothetical protein